MTKFVKVMFGTTSGAKSDFKYKVNEVNIANNWNPRANNPKEMGGFNFSTEDKIIRWLHRGDTIYDVIIPDDAEVIDVVESATPHGVFRANKIIITNPRKINDNMALHFYEMSTIPEFAYYKALGAVSIMNYKKTALAIFNDKINKDNIDIVMEEWNDFINSKEQRKNSTETVVMIKNMLLKMKNK